MEENIKVKAELLRKVNFKKGNGLVPVVVQDKETGKVLMVAYANEEALNLTIETGIAHYYSRSRKKIWKKGETSGNLQLVKEIYVDCDEDTLFYVVEPKGPACHTGNVSCFFRKLAWEEE